MVASPWRQIVSAGALTYLWWQLLLDGHWNGQWQWEESELLVEVVLEHEGQKSGALDHLLLASLSWRWGQAY